MASGLDERVSQSLIKSREALMEAEVLFSRELYNGSVSRSYYAIHHAANAMLLARQFEFSKHSAVIAALGREFVRSGLIDQRYHKIAIDAFEARQTAEYDIFNQANRSFADKVYSEAADFISMAERFLGARSDK